MTHHLISLALAGTDVTLPSFLLLSTNECKICHNPIEVINTVDLVDTITAHRVLTVSFHKFGNAFFPGTGELSAVGQGA